VHCENGSIYLNANAGLVEIHRRNQAPEIIQVPEDERYPRFGTSQNLVDIALGKAQNASPAEVGLRTVELLDAAYRSAENDGQKVSIEELYAD